MTARREAEKNFKEELEHMNAQIEQLKKAILHSASPSRPPPKPEDHKV